MLFKMNILMYKQRNGKGPRPKMTEEKNINEEQNTIHGMVTSNLNYGYKVIYWLGLHQDALN